MSHEAEIALLESEWCADEGFFWKIREGKFNSEDFQRALQKLSGLSIAEDAVLPRRIVSLLWYIPVFMGWQSDRVEASGGDPSAYARAVTAMTNEIERLLGVP